MASDPRRDDDGARHVLAAIVLECHSAATPETLDRDAAERIGAALASDLATLMPGVAGLDLVLAGALYDQAQVLRPAWPIHAALGELHARIRGAADRDAGVGAIVALGASGGRMPVPTLQPDRRLYGSPLLLLPWMLAGPADTLRSVAAQLERELFDRGLAGAALAIELRDRFDIALTHARHMTAFDLCALACAQYEHAGFGPIWQIVEAAIVAPESVRRVEFGGGEIRYERGEAVARGVEPRAVALAKAILGAHGVELGVA